MAIISTNSTRVSLSRLLLLFRTVIGWANVCLAVLLESATANGYKQGAHQKMDSKRDDTKHIKELGFALGRYEK